MAADLGHHHRWRSDSQPVADALHHAGCLSRIRLARTPLRVSRRQSHRRASHRRLASELFLKLLRALHPTACCHVADYYSYFSFLTFRVSFFPSSTLSPSHSSYYLL